ncbi:MAG: site-specific integrase [Desulfobacteraceae bacterium]|nr:site-specific integrase [Desulfobacteraceae bacterium]
MKKEPTFPSLLESFFTVRLIKQKGASPNTIASYRDSFRLLFEFVQKQLKKSPTDLTVNDLDASFIGSFLDYLENNRKNGHSSRNLRLAAIRSFFKYVALEEPGKAAHIERILAIPKKRETRTLIDFLTRPEINALLAEPNKNRWAGRRDYAMLMLTIQTGLRVSELINLRCQDMILDTGAHVRCHGKGRKDRCTPLTKKTAQVMKAWIREQCDLSPNVLFPNARGKALSRDGVQYILSKYIKIAQNNCPTLKTKRITPHTLRHTAAMELLQAGVDRSVIALWLGHESPETTQIYLKANLAMKEEILSKIRPLNVKAGRFRPKDHLLDFLNSL